MVLIGGSGQHIAHWATCCMCGLQKFRVQVEPIDAALALPLLVA